jgi:conjugative relaxase-like TrwC/TraI family protein
VRRDHRMMVCHVLHAGDGYTYLTRQVATDDVLRRGRDPLTEYYHAHGNRPGQWVGAGLADLGVSGEVDEEQMLALFGEGLRPDANEFIAARRAEGVPFAHALREARLGRRFYRFKTSTPLAGKIKEAFAAFEVVRGRRPTVAERREIIEVTAQRLLNRSGKGNPSAAEIRRYIVDELGCASQPVAGFDLVFTPVKSVSVLWGLGQHHLRATIEQIHEHAWRAALAYGEREAAFTRTGVNGVAFVPTAGFVATAFQHRDSRAGDPNLHTHVAVSNRVLAADGVWRTIDSRQLHKVAVSMSEVYNTLIEQGMTERLGVRFVDIDKGPGKRPVREIAGVPQQWLRGFSQRRAQVEAGYEHLVRDYVRRHGRTPPRSVQVKLAQQATLADRPDKAELKTLAEQVAEWRSIARDLIPGVDIERVIAAAITRPVPIADLVDVARVAENVIGTVATERAHWTVYHVRAEAHRQLRGHSFESADDRLRVAESVTQAALARHSVMLDIEIDELPDFLARPDGTSVFRRHGSERFSSLAVLDAEQILVDATRRDAGPVVTPADLRRAIREYENARGRKVRLNPGQRALVEHFVSSGRALAVAIGPPGTGKSTAMGAVRQAWETTGGRVIGLAPSAAAASVLGDELGVTADTLHKLLHTHAIGEDVDVRAGDLLLVDEAGMAGTRLLADLHTLASERGAVIRLIGDHRQLAAVEAGGALRLLHHETGGTELSEVHRFRHPDEAQAVLRFRVGDERALTFYADNHRLNGGVRAAVLDTLYRDWSNDLAENRTAIMISNSTDVVRELSARAQLDRRASGQAEPHGVLLHDGTLAGAGDRIVTRRNRRTLLVDHGHDYVKNGDLWEVRKRFTDGSLHVQHIGHGGTVLLPAHYATRWVELGYSATVHRSQGLTVEISRTFLTPTATREAALVALSRGTDANHAYLDTEQLLHPDEPDTLPGDLYYRHREPQLARAALAQILQHEGAELSATETLRAAHTEPEQLDVLVPQYDHARELLRPPGAAEQAEQWIRTSLPDRADDILTDEAWPTLQRLLHDLDDARIDPAEALSNAANERRLENDPLDPAESVARVLHYRLARHVPFPESSPLRPDLLPGWIATPPQQTDADPARSELQVWTLRQVDRIVDRIHQLGVQAAADRPPWSARLGPVPTDPVARDEWVGRAGQLGAYRERWQIADGRPNSSVRGGGEQARAHRWVQQYLARTELPTTRPDASRSRRIQDLRNQFYNLDTTVRPQLDDLHGDATARTADTELCPRDDAPELDLT